MRRGAYGEIDIYNGSADPINLVGTRPTAVIRTSTRTASPAPATAPATSPPGRPAIGTIVNTEDANNYGIGNESGSTNNTISVSTG
jgi:hypothetical protein